MKRVSFISLFLLLAAALLMTGCGSTQPEAQAAPLSQEEPATPVEVAKVETGDITQVFSYAGDLQPKDDVNLVPGAAGRITDVLVEVGDKVEAGQSIAKIEQDNYAAQLKQAEAGLATAKLNLAKMELGPRPEEISAAQAAVQLARASVKDVSTISDNERTQAATLLANAQAALRKAQADYDKIAWAGDVGSTSQALALEQATNAYETALATYNLATNPSDVTLAPLMAQLTQAELALALTLQPFREIDFEMARIGIQQAEAAVALARKQLAETTIMAPFDGVIAELYVTKGSMVGPQVPIVMFVSDQVEVLINIEENRVGQIVEDQSAALRVAAYPGQDFPAVVTSIAPIADKSTHTFAVKITPIDEEGQLRSGMYADVSILAKENENALLVPRAAVVLVNGQDTVYVVKENNTVEQRPVTLGLTDKQFAEVLTGLDAGETVVTAGQPNLIDGAPIEIINGSQG